MSSKDPHKVALTADKAGFHLPQDGNRWTYWKSFESGLRAAIAFNLTDDRKAREGIARWRTHYNTERPHSALGYLSPKEFLMTNPAPALETLSDSAPALNTENQPENSGSTWP